jgi:DNA-binding transcriptional LysR family regulator
VISASARRLSVFTSVVDAGGFNSAAVRLGIAQPSVGAHVKALEDQIGQKLFFRRRGTRPQLTKAGETLYAYAVEFLQKSQETTTTLSDLRSLDTREVSLALHRDVAPHVMATHLASFTRSFPKVRMVTRTGTIEDVVALVREHVVNLAIVLAAGPVTGLQSDALSKVPLWLVVARNHPLATRKDVQPDEVLRYPFFTGLRNSRYMQIAGLALKEVGIAQFDVTMELQDSASIKEMLRLGQGIAALPSCAVDQEIAAGTLVAVKLAARPRDLELRCAYYAPLPPAARDFLGYVRGKL